MARDRTKALEWGSGKRSKTSNKLGSPVPADGSNGDIEVRQTNLGGKIFAKLGGRWYNTPLSLDDTIRLGVNLSDHLSIERDSINIYTDNVKVATFGRTTTVKDIHLTGKVDVVGTDNNVCIGTNNSDSGDDNVVIGTNAGENLASGGDSNVLIGKEAGNDVTTGDHNILIGTNSGEKITTAQRNVCIGFDAGADLTHNSGNSNTDADNVLIGSFAGMDDADNDNPFGTNPTNHELTTGKNNVLIGSKTSVDNAAGENRIAIGYRSLSIINNSATIGNLDCTDIYLGQGAQFSGAGGANIHFKGLRPNYESGWTYVLRGGHASYPAGGYDFTHSLGTYLLLVFVYFSNGGNPADWATAAGTGDNQGGPVGSGEKIFLITSGMSYEASTSNESGCHVHLLSKDVINLGFGEDFVYKYDNIDGITSPTGETDGYVKVIAYSTGLVLE